jgi:hypothetical protein
MNDYALAIIATLAAVLYLKVAYEMWTVKHQQKKSKNKQ